VAGCFERSNELSDSKKESGEFYEELSLCQVLKD
jgi:hypothetical protein